MILQNNNQTVDTRLDIHASSGCFICGEPIKSNTSIGICRDCRLAVIYAKDLMKLSLKDIYKKKEGEEKDGL